MRVAQKNFLEIVISLLLFYACALISLHTNSYMYIVSENTHSPHLGCLDLSVVQKADWIYQEWFIIHVFQRSRGCLAITIRRKIYTFSITMLLNSLRFLTATRLCTELGDSSCRSYLVDLCCIDMVHISSVKSGQPFFVVCLPYYRYARPELLFFPPCSSITNVVYMYMYF